MSSSPLNIREYTVTELSGAIKRTLEDAYGYVRVRGEIGRVSRPGSGHIYLDLKDEKAVLNGVVWKGQALRLKIRPEQGLEVVCTGRLTTFAGQSRYQLIIEEMEPAGVGALMALLEERRKKLAAEGLFDEAHKKPLPFLPEVIGVVTSPTGAVIRDILHRLHDRFPRHVLIWPTLVQGEKAADQIAAGIEGFNALKPGGPVPRPDVIIVARGGGSIEDLWPFNEEIVVRAAFASAIPLISAVGHETDTTLIDFAADRRAPTPTAAAEIAVPVRGELVAQVAELTARALRAETRALDHWKTALAGLARGLPKAEDIVGLPAQRLDHVSARLHGSLTLFVERRSVDFARRARLPKAEDIVNLPAQRLDHVSARLHGSLTLFVERRSVDFARRARLSPQPLKAALRHKRDQLKGLEARLARARGLTVDQADQRLTRLAAALHRRGLAAPLKQAQERAAGLTRRLDIALDRIVRDKAEQLTARARLLESFSHQSVLKRGFALVQSADGALIRRAGDTAPGQPVALTFADGRVGAVIGPKTAEPDTPAAEKPKKTAKKATNPQGSLF